MAYNRPFYEMYREYLQEKVVRENHDCMFRLFRSLTVPESLRVIDLGCGVGEYATYDYRYASYVGIDLNNTGALKNFLQADYLKLDFKDRLLFTPNAFVSLFSLECFHPASARYAFYEKLFGDFPAIRFGLVSGFFYESRRDQETVSETGGITSYQTVEDPARFISPVFTELRVHMRTPSKMFGQDVVEVWKILVRK